MRGALVLLALFTACATAYDQQFHWSGDYTLPTAGSVVTFAGPASGCRTAWLTTVQVTGNVDSSLNGTAIFAHPVNWSISCAHPPCACHMVWDLHCVPPDDLNLRLVWTLMPCVFLLTSGVLWTCCPPPPKKLRTPKLLA